MTATTTKVTKDDVKSKLDDIVSELANSPEPIEIEENGETVAVLISPEEFRVYNRERAWRVIDAWRARNSHKTLDEIDADGIDPEITAIVEEVRQELYDEEVAKSGSS